MSDQEPQTARKLFEAAGLEPTEQELELFDMLYPILRERADQLYEEDLGDQG